MTEIKPNQENAPLPDDVVVELERAGRKVVKEKLGERRATVLTSTLGGSVGQGQGSREFKVTVRTNSFIMNVQDPVDTNIGEGEVDTVYTTDSEGEAMVSVTFTSEQLEEHTDWENPL